MAGVRQTVLLTDRAWPDDDVERAVLAAAGLDLVAGPADPAGPDVIAQLVAEHQPAAVLTCWAQVSAAAVQASPGLRLVARMGVGLDNIDVDAATARGVLVTNVPDYCVDEVSDTAVAMVLDWTRGLARADREVHAGRWEPASHHLRRLRALTVGILGYGRIGRATAGKLQAFGCTLLASDPHPPADPSPARLVPMQELLRRSDAVVLHAPLTEATRGLVGADELALMKPGALLVNVSRGGLVDTAALVAALASGRPGAAALDVLDTEPQVPPDLLARPDVLLTPHIAFSSDAAVLDLRRSAAEEVVRVLSGEPARFACNRPAVLAPAALAPAVLAPVGRS